MLYVAAGGSAILHPPSNGPVDAEWANQNRMSGGSETRLLRDRGRWTAMSMRWLAFAAIQ
jgi:hypothetical protein